LFDGSSERDMLVRLVNNCSHKFSFLWMRIVAAFEDHGNATG